MNVMKSFYLTIILIPLFLAAGCADPVDPFSFNYDFSTVPELPDTTSVEAVKQDNGLIYYVIEEGDSSEEGNSSWTVQGRSNERLSLFLTLRADGGIEQSTYANGREVPETVTMGALAEPTGLFDGMIGMREGERRVLVMPPEIGYKYAGSNSQFWYLQNDTLIYDIELVNIN